MFLLMGGAFLLFGWSLAAAMFVAGRSLARRRYVFGLVWPP
jgi:hypothetical protein